MYIGSLLVSVDVELAVRMASDLSWCFRLVDIACVLLSVTFDGGGAPQAINHVVDDVLIHNL